MCVCVCVYVCVCVQVLAKYIIPSKRRTVKQEQHVEISRKTVL